MSLSPGEGGGGVLLTVTHFNSDEEEEEEEEGDLIYIPCKVIMFGHFQIIWKTCSFPPLSTTSSSSFSSSQCLGRDVNVLIDTGCRLNLISSLTVDRLG